MTALPIRKIEIARFPARMRFAFSHASARRAETDNIIVVVRGESGLVGYGEGCPREYVTGETSQLNARRLMMQADRVECIANHGCVKRFPQFR